MHYSDFTMSFRQANNTVNAKLSVIDTLSCLIALFLPDAKHGETNMLNDAICLPF